MFLVIGNAIGYLSRNNSASQAVQFVLAFCVVLAVLAALRAQQRQDERMRMAAAAKGQAQRARAAAATKPAKKPYSRLPKQAEKVGRGRRERECRAA